MKGNKSKLDYLNEKYSGNPRSKQSKAHTKLANTQLSDEPFIFDNDQDLPVVVEDPKGLLKSSKRAPSQSNWVTLEEGNPSAGAEPSKRKRLDSDSEDETPLQDPAIATFKVDESGDFEPPRPKERRMNQEAIEEVGEVPQTSAETVYRKAGVRISKEAAQMTERERLRKLNEEQLSKWGKGIRQRSEEEERAIFEANISKQPLRNTEISEEVDEELKQVSRFGDPMRDLIGQKKQKEGVIVFSSKFKAPPNRYGIQPGHRWDGVDRGNGFEKKLLLARNERVANEADAYKWRTEDM
eukprot:TRINITY_DN9324_c0_g1_i1.p1 TRINITY_DN9324_c0_g1~~TRINITY_DN9324_c0_g1_i1.p1  ORF type:complete len:297 (+),score=107.19 TRINITY_DN9324_c0_g1_i1:63-953(+)